MKIKADELGWTGRDCPQCKGFGERYSPALDYDAHCPDCGGTGDENIGANNEIEVPDEP